MGKFLVFFAFTLSFFALTPSLHAEGYGRNGMNLPSISRGRTVTSDPQPTAYTSNDYKWVGLSSDSSVVSTETPALTFLMPLGEKLALQTYAVITSVNPFLFGIGGNVKYNVVGDLMKGIHVGGGVGLGLVAATSLVGGATLATNAFFFNINGILGFHFHLIDRILFSLDAGLHISIANGTTAVALSGDSALMGLSVLYRL